MRLGRRLMLLSFVLVMSGCALFASKETRYLQSAQGQATQEEVKQKLGPPLLTDMREGETVWVYQVREQQYGSRINASGLWCDEYVLTFDGQGVLQRWAHRSKFHGGESMPNYCVPNGYKPVS